MKLSDVRGLRVIVWGGAREGYSAAEICLRQNCQVAIVSDTPDSDVDAQRSAQALDVSLLGVHQIPEWNPDFIIRSPGVSRYREELANYASSGLLALWLADQDPRRIIGVTGTKGKSTTSALIANILRSAGHSVELAGNIGVPVAQTSRTADFLVIEVSSYQASDCTTSPSIGVLTSLGEDHIPWHGSVATYHRDKLNLFGHTQLEHVVCHASDQEHLVAHGLENVLKKRFSNSQHSVHVALATPQGEAALERMGNTTFPRNLELAMDAALAADNSLTLAHVLDALDSTQPLPSRQQLVATKGDRQFVDDALASNPLGVIAAIERFDHSRFVLIMGGEDRNVDFGPLCDAVNAAQHLGAIVVLGAPSTRLYKELLTTRATVCPANSDNVADAVEIAVSLTQSGDRVVFSPGAPTPRDIGDYRTRSAQFAAGIDRITFS